MTIEQMKAKIEQLEAQVLRVQDTEYGTVSGQNQINALNQSIGQLERNIKIMETNAIWAKVSLKIKRERIELSKRQKELLDSIKFWQGQGQSICVDGRTLKNLEILEEWGLITIQQLRNRKYGAKLAEITE